MNIPIMMFALDVLNHSLINGKFELDVGSRVISTEMSNFSNNIKKLTPSSYIGVDFIEGENVDLVLDAEDVVNEFGLDCFDIVLCTEMVDHAKNWKYVVRNIK